MTKTSRTSKGAVAIQADANRLRLRWRNQGKRYTLAVGLPDTPVNRKVAQQRATQIELDMAAGSFDSTLRKYKPHIPEPCSIFVEKLFEQFMVHKAKEVSDRTLEKYISSLKHLRRFYGDQRYAIGNIDEKAAENFYSWFVTQKLAPRTLKERLNCIREVWNWAVEKDFITVNPWAELPNRIKIPPKQKPKPFTTEEITAIIQTFRKSVYYNYYTDYVEFLFGTGCRTSEVIGLRWKHLSDDCSSVWIGETLSRKVRKATKTNKDRTIILTPALQQLLLNRKPENPDPDDLVFLSKEGGSIDDHNFRNRAWVSVLKQAKVKYRKPYNTRHTFISHALEKGMNPVMVAQLTGHDVKTLYENYAGCIDSSPKLPELNF
ncbi:tyrosine-type recombinase/integrase [Limnoraphis robusta]|uniref:Tyrosine-type recombinase/integrase n=1 Tax=Limnoraphis robusta CCNP1315 TaxID=3110306 RepID=A0ABU5U2F6_9CYAN|nr:tyrosine-type recombinase/integrase [Limnoraphis robusta]MEA5521378.1 tyrosine-type recombinase/integrase [Limnoraphis robusta CCNP1315]MEA5547945.1 tyrosine-type recombinase/integrase [Limnoraphis robusta CCNP1324]